jgi:WhiB family redox-sensing transcriptional regulator
LKKFDWMDDAACKGLKSVSFFPEESFNSEAPKAIAVCRACPVRVDCLDFAVQNSIQYGIWGGMTPVRRKQYLRAGKPEDMLDS